MKIDIRHSYTPKTQNYALTVFIDVFRATTTLLYITASGAEKVVNTASEETAKQLMGQGYELISEVLKGGADNSPYYISTSDLKGKKLIHKTGNFSNSLAFNRNFKKGLACGFVNINATANYIKNNNFKSVEIVTSDNFPARTSAVEDLACAHYLKAMLEGQNPSGIENLPQIKDKAKRRVDCGWFGPDYLKDTDMALTLNTFDYAVEIVPSDNGCFEFKKAETAQPE